MSRAATHQDVRRKTRAGMIKSGRNGTGELGGGRVKGGEGRWGQWGCVWSGAQRWHGWPGTPPSPNLCGPGFYPRLQSPSGLFRIDGETKPCKTKTISGTTQRKYWVQQLNGKEQFFHVCSRVQILIIVFKSSFRTTWR